MPDPILIDLTRLTQDHIDEALPHMGSCSYSAPCIIGTLLTPEQRERLDAAEYKSGGTYGVDSFVKRGVLKFPDDAQAEYALQLQEAFDDGTSCDAQSEFLTLASKWVEATPPEQGEEA